MTSQFDVDCRHYGDGKLDTACLVDINDHQESTEHHRQRTVRQTTETPQRQKRVIVSWTKLEKHEKDRQVSKFTVVTGVRTPKPWSDNHCH